MMNQRGISRMHLQWISTGFDSAPGDVGLLVRGNDQVLGRAGDPHPDEGGVVSTLLLDCGASVPDSLLKLGLQNQVTDIVITDARHAGGLARLALIYYIQSRGSTKIKPTLHLAKDTARTLWEMLAGSEMGTMPELLGSGEGVRAELWSKIVEKRLGELPGGFGEPREATIEDYFYLQEFLPGRETIQVNGLHELKLIRNLGGSGSRFPSYGGFFRSGGFYFSGNTARLPPFLKPDISIFFQYCCIGGESPDDRDVLPYKLLKEKIPQKFRGKTYLVPVDGVFDDEDPVEDGFAGEVFPFQEFIFDGESCKELPFVLAEPEGLSGQTR